MGGFCYNPVMSKEGEQNLTIADVVTEAVGTTIRAGFIAATGPIGMGIAAVGEIIVINEARKKILEINKAKRQPLSNTVT